MTYRRFLDECRIRVEGFVAWVKFVDAELVRRNQLRVLCCSSFEYQLARAYSEEHGITTADLVAMASRERRPWRENLELY
jgi:hypothetical protein